MRCTWEDTAEKTPLALLRRQTLDEASLWWNVNVQIAFCLIRHTVQFTATLSSTQKPASSIKCCFKASCCYFRLLHLAASCRYFLSPDIGWRWIACFAFEARNRFTLRSWNPHIWIYRFATVAPCWYLENSHKLSGEQDRMWSSIRLKNSKGIDWKVSSERYRLKGIDWEVSA